MNNRGKPRTGLQDRPKWALARKGGRGDRIRTCDPLLPKQMRYQAALLPDRSADGPLRVRFGDFPGVVGPAGFEPAT